MRLLTAGLQVRVLLAEHGDSGVHTGSPFLSLLIETVSSQSSNLPLAPEPFFVVLHTGEFSNKAKPVFRLVHIKGSFKTRGT